MLPCDNGQMPFLRGTSRLYRRGMTTTEKNHADAAAHRTSTVRRALTVLATIAGPILITVATALDWTGGGGDPLDYLASLRQNPGVYLASGMLLVFGMALLPVTAMTLFRVAAARRRAMPLRVGAVLIAAWGVLGVGGVSLGYTAGWVGADLVGTVPDEIVGRVFLGVTYSPWGVIGGGLGGAAFAAGMLATGVGVILLRGVPSWPGVLILAGLVVAFTGGPLGIHWLASGGLMLLTIALVGLTPTIRRQVWTE